jgi:hypothetical protein
MHFLTITVFIFFFLYTELSIIFYSSMFILHSAFPMSILWLF